MTRAVLGVGIGLLLAERLGTTARKAAGWALIVSGTLATIPLALEVLHKGRVSEDAGAVANGRPEFQDWPRPSASAIVSP